MAEELLSNEASVRRNGNATILATPSRESSHRLTRSMLSALGV
jgi:hypothetical protein